MFGKFQPFLSLMRIDRPVGSLLLLWPTLIALWVANNGFPSLHLFIVFVLGVFLMRSAGCVINDLCDRDFDKKVSRTKKRPLATGAVSVKSAWLLFAGLLFFSFLLVLTLNVITIGLSVLAAVFAAIYPLAKRYTYFPQVVLAIAWSFGILMAFTATVGHVPVVGWCLFLANMVWTVAYDTQYAMVDYQDDLKAGIKSTAVFFGKKSVSAVVFLQFLTLVLFSIVGFVLQLSFYYDLALLITLLLFVYQYSLLKSKLTSNYFKAFLNNQCVGLVLFVAVFLSNQL